MNFLKKFLKWTGITLVIAIAAFTVYVMLQWDRKFDAPYPAIKASTDSAVLARGKYLVYGPAHCAECHAPTSQFEKVEMGEEIPLSGGFDFKLPFGTLYAPNITPDKETGIGNLTDGEIARALRYGVRHDGGALIDIMPFYHMSEADLTAVISYIRSMPPVKNKRPQHEWNFIGKAILATLIKPMGDGKFDNPPAEDSTIEYGHYIAESVANCRGCHTNRDFKTGAYIGEYYAGGTPFEVFGPQATIVENQYLVTPNLTPDPETGRIAGWSQQQFMDRFRQGRLLNGSPMPWGPFSRMSDVEIVALYKYLTSLKPVKNETPAGIQHGEMPM